VPSRILADDVGNAGLRGDIVDTVGHQASRLDIAVLTDNPVHTVRGVELG
jgi:hypothetical protein